MFICPKFIENTYDRFVAIPDYDERDTHNLMWDINNNERCILKTIKYMKHIIIRKYNKYMMKYLLRFKNKIISTFI